MTEGMEIIHDYSPEDFEPHGDVIVLFRDDDVEKTEAGIIFPNNKVRWTVGFTEWVMESVVRNFKKMV